MIQNPKMTSSILSFTANFAIAFANLRKLEENVRSGSVSSCNFSRIEVRTW